MSTARDRFCSLLSLLLLFIVVCSRLLDLSSAQALPSQFEEFLMTMSLDSNETEPSSSNTRSRQAPSDAGASVNRSDSPDGVSDRPTTSEATAEGEEEEQNDPLNGQTGTELLSYFKYVPRQHWSCCMLGLLAGNKGFQCRAEFYSARLTLRNVNRPQSIRHSGGGVGGHSAGRDRAKDYEIMRTFRRCVTKSAHEFHRCCHVAVTESQELGVARSYRRNRSSSR